MTAAVDVRIRRAVLLRGQRQEPGQVLTLSARDAADLIASGRVTLVDAADATTVTAARRRDDEQALRLAARPVPGAFDDPRWLRRGR